MPGKGTESPPSWGEKFYIEAIPVLRVFQETRVLVLSSTSYPLKVLSERLLKMVKSWQNQRC